MRGKTKKDKTRKKGHWEKQEKANVTSVEDLKDKSESFAFQFTSGTEKKV